ncbi:MAG: prepilin-type N-terminal cleavage/methylation domain-containing protein [Syntrophorhabdaceae bacterium]|nr:prepilin-type N-terminal cleavage/methylation domain-containing protein [Syntrophorhabdaceae bacterium]
MIKRENGFSLIELMISIAIVSIVFASAVSFFILSMRQYKTQTKITASGLEGIIGLEMLRRDIEDIGFGLPWNNLAPYTEIVSGDAVLMALNDGGVAPRAIVGIDNATFTVNRSDYFAIKSSKVGIQPAAGKWTFLDHFRVKRQWVPLEENMGPADWSIVLSVGSTDSNRRSLVMPGSYLQYSGDPTGYAPSESYAVNIMYGISSGDANRPVRPFNRADYFISNADVPTRCAPDTGVLVKGVINHDVAGTMTLLPLLDCVADIQVTFGLDINNDRLVDTWGDWTNTLSTMNAAQIRTQLMEVRVSILTHEGQRDDSFTYPDNTVFVGATVSTPLGIQNHGKQANVGTRKNYRWKLYNLAVKPLSLAQ